MEQYVTASSHCKVSTVDCFQLQLLENYGSRGFYLVAVIKSLYPLFSELSNPLFWVFSWFVIVLHQKYMGFLFWQKTYWRFDLVSMNEWMWTLFRFQQQNHCIIVIFSNPDVLQQTHCSMAVFRFLFIHLCSFMLWSLFRLRTLAHSFFFFCVLVLSSHFMVLFFFLPTPLYNKVWLLIMNMSFWVFLFFGHLYLYSISWLFCIFNHWYSGLLAIAFLGLATPHCDLGIMNHGLRNWNHYVELTVL